MDDACEHYAETFPDMLERWIEEGAVVCGEFAFDVKGKVADMLPLTPLERAIAVHGEDAVRKFIFDGGQQIAAVVPLPASALLLIGALVMLWGLRK